MCAKQGHTLWAILSGSMGARLALCCHRQRCLPALGNGV